MELLIIKTEGAYIRCTNDVYIETGLDKASVYPIDQLEQVKTHLAAVKENGFTQARIKKLVLTEKDI